MGLSDKSIADIKKKAAARAAASTPVKTKKPATTKVVIKKKKKIAPPAPIVEELVEIDELEDIEEVEDIEEIEEMDAEYEESEEYEEDVVEEDIEEEEYEYEEEEVEEPQQRPIRVKPVSQPVKNKIKPKIVRTTTLPIQNKKPSNIYNNFRKIIAETGDSKFSTAPNGTYTGIIEKFLLTKSKKTQKKQFEITIQTETFNGAPHNRKLWSYLAIEHEVEDTMKRANQKLNNLLNAIDIAITDDTDLEDLFNNMTQHFGGFSCVVEVTRGYPTITKCGEQNC